MDTLHGNRAIFLIEFEHDYNVIVVSYKTKTMEELGKLYPKAISISYISCSMVHIYKERK